MEKHSQETRQADRESEKPVDSLHPGSGTAKHLSPAASQEGRRRREGAKRGQRLGGSGAGVRSLLLRPYRMDTSSRHAR